jgi:hypothetical protein
MEAATMALTAAAGSQHSALVPRKTLRYIRAIVGLTEARFARSIDVRPEIRGFRIGTVAAVDLGSRINTAGTQQ